MTTPRARPLPDHPLQYRAALQGYEPADALTTRDRHRLVALFVDAGWSDTAIADLTRLTPYTAARIRQQLFLRRLRDGAHTTRSGRNPTGIRPDSGGRRAC